MNKSLKVGVVGAGYVGLVTAVCLASKGFRVILVEADKEKIKSIEKEEVPFFEPGLGVFLKSAFKKKLIELSDSIESLMLQKPEIVLSCVGTPSALAGTPDLSSV